MPPIVERSDIEAKAQRPLTEDEWIRASGSLIPQVQDVIENYLGQAFGERQVVELLVPVQQVLYPSVMPLLGVVSITTADGTPVTMYEQINVERIRVYDDAPVTITYRAGQPSVPASLRGFVASAVARTLLTPPLVGLHIMGSYNVEGTSVTFSPSMTDGNAEGHVVDFTVGEINALDRYRRLPIS